MPSYWQETPSCYNLSHPSLSCRTSLCSFLQCQGLAELHLMWFVQALIMHLQDARCMNSSSSRSAGRLLHRIVLLSRDGGGKRTARACTHPRRSPGLGARGVLLLWGVSLHPHTEVRLRIMNIAGAIPAARRSLPAVQGNPVERLEVSGDWLTLEVWPAGLEHCPTAKCPVTAPKHPKNLPALPPSAPRVPPSGQHVSGAQKREDIIYLPHLVWTGDFTLRITAQARLPAPGDGEGPWWPLSIGTPLSAFPMRGRPPHCPLR